MSKITIEYIYYIVMHIVVPSMYTSKRKQKKKILAVFQFAEPVQLFLCVL